MPEATSYKQHVTEMVCVNCPVREAANLPLKQRLEYFGKSLAQTLIERKVLAPADLIEKRTTICNNCPSGKKQGNRCLDCGCNLKLKTRLIKFKCTLGHWDDVDEQNDKGE